MSNYSRLQIRKRITALFLIVVFLMLGLFVRLVWVQVVNGPDYCKKALDQRLRELPVTPKRGIIYDRNGKELVASGTAETIAAYPAQIKDPNETAKALAQVLEASEEEIYKKITQNRSSVYLKRRVDEQVAAKVKELDLPGIGFTMESKRFYPNKELAAHLLGFSGDDGDGLEGLETTLDHYLMGVPGSIAIEKDGKNRELHDGVQKYYPPKDGSDVYLTIDEVIQYIAERELEAGLTIHKANGGSVIVMNPETGEILALTNRPTYDPNDFRSYNQGNWRNRAVVDTYEPGSTFKIITTVTALEEGVVNVNDSFFCKGSITVAGENIACWEEKGHGSQTFAEVVEHSCNPGFVQVGQRIGAETLDRYITAFGFGRKTNVGLSGEAPGSKYPLEKIGPVELATISFGHSISVSPMQLITAVSAVANDGLLLQPQIVKEVKTNSGELVKGFEIIPVRQVISKETAQLASKLLANVVKNGTGKNAQVEGYEIAGKTGTAQAYGGEKKYNSSFIGYVPADDPKLVILVVLYDVTSYPHFGSQTAAPIFQKIAKSALLYLEIPPKKPSEEEDTKNKPKEIEVPDFRNQSVETARKELLRMGFLVKVEGNNERVVNQVPVPGAIMPVKSTVILFTQNGIEEEKRYLVTVPDLKGMTVEKAAQILAKLGLKIQYSTGQGKIINQVPAPNVRVKSGTEIKIFVN